MHHKTYIVLFLVGKYICCGRKKIKPVNVFILISDICWKPTVKECPAEGTYSQLSTVSTDSFIQRRKLARQLLILVLCLTWACLTCSSTCWNSFATDNELVPKCRHSRIKNRWGKWTTYFCDGYATFRSGRMGPGTFTSSRFGLRTFRSRHFCI